MFFIFVQVDRLGQVVEIAVHADADIAALFCVLKGFDVLALSGADNRRQNLDARGFRKRQHLVHNLIHRLLADFLPADRAVRHAHPGPQKAQVIVNLCHRSHSGPGIPAGGFLVNGNCRGKAVDAVHIRLIHLSQKLPGIGGQGLHIPPLSLRINRIKRQRRLAAAGNSGNHRELVTGNVYIHIFQVVFPRAADAQALLHTFSLASVFCLRTGSARKTAKRRIFRVRMTAFVIIACFPASCNRNRTYVLYPLSENSVFLPPPALNSGGNRVILIKTMQSIS